MRPVRWCRATALAGALAVTAGCAVSGSAAVASLPPGSPVASTTDVAPARLLPQRPRDVNISGLDPCRALATEQLKGLDYDLGWQRPPRPGTDTISGKPNCTFVSDWRQIGVVVVFVDNADAQVWLTDPDHKPDRAPARVTVPATDPNGFPALAITVAPTEPLPNKCNLIVDVHDGQYLDVFSTLVPGSHLTGTAPYCAEAEKVAALVIQNAEKR